MEKNLALRGFFKEHANQLTEEWYATLEDHDPKSVYSATDPKIVETLKQQNNEFHHYVNDIFVEEESSFFTRFNSWIVKIAQDSQHAVTPIHYIVREFIRTREQYLDYLKKFIEQYPEVVPQCQKEEWNRLVIRVIDITITRFIEEYYKHSNTLLEAQQDMINELSSPVISLKGSTALLPLVGDIDTSRAKRLIENTLQQCTDKGVSHLFIDLSGVVMVDTMVANQIFQLMEALRMLGVNTTLSGIRPEIAATAIQLGLSFENVKITSTLSQAITLSEK
ncbi:STAS domain-containing protein [Peribacillus alkalitolerans]|uniref:STAS domain-containing protein n=1 Tax=Peribacillus alkalitolerans TaxID=1550385 RepID=UPI0013D7C39B|nr:STAS domain-containing protein [Peribacillus alkalitolerans]